MAEIDYTRLKAILDTYGLNCIAQMQQILQNKGARNLQNQLNHQVVEDIDYVNLVITMPEYGIWADAGRGPGVFPPPDAIKDWMISRGIDLKYQYPIARKIASEGTKNSAKDFIQTFYLLQQVYADQISQAVTEDYVQAIRQSFTEE